MNQAHEFALYNTAIIVPRVGNTFTVDIAQKELLHRLIFVLRVMPGQQLTFFNDAQSYAVTVENVSKKSVTLSVKDSRSHQQVSPHINLILPLLKKEALEASLYAAVEMQVHTIYLVHTQFSQHTRDSETEHARYMRIMIAAAEQCKQFMLPQLKEIVELSKIVTEISGTKLIAQPDGVHSYAIIQQLKANPTETITYMVGPEADLSAEELQLLQKHHFQSMALTPSILRSSQAVIIGLGILRSLLAS